MPETTLPDKDWWRSKGAVANLLGIVLGLLVTTGVIEIDGQTRDAILAQGPDLWMGVVTTFINAVGLWGRIKANTRLRWPFLRQA